MKFLGGLWYRVEEFFDKLLLGFRLRGEISIMAELMEAKCRKLDEEWGKGTEVTQKEWLTKLDEELYEFENALIADRDHPFEFACECADVMNCMAFLGYGALWRSTETGVKEKRGTNNGS
jgi:hypothetical protein